MIIYPNILIPASTKANTCAKTRPEWDLRDDGKEIYQGRNSRVSVVGIKTQFGHRHNTDTTQTQYGHRHRHRHNTDTIQTDRILMEGDLSGKERQGECCCDKKGRTDIIQTQTQAEYR